MDERRFEGAVGLFRGRYGKGAARTEEACRYVPVRWIVSNAFAIALGEGPGHWGSALRICVCLRGL